MSLPSCVVNASARRSIPRYLEDAHEPMDTAEFDGLVREDTRWTMWEGFS